MKDNELQNKNFAIRKVEEQDSYYIWEIRNHPSVRVISDHPEAIPFENHSIWFKEKYFSGQDNHCFVLATSDNKVIGYCRLDLDKEKNYYIVSIALAPDFQGKGLGKNLLSESLCNFGDDKIIFAEIHKNNIRSIKLFEKNGFLIKNEDENNYYLIREKAMEQKQKTIFIVITRSLITRNILRSGTLDLLKKEGWRVVVFFQAKEIPEYLKNEFKDDNVILIAHDTFLRGLHRRFGLLGRYLIFTDTTKLLARFRVSRIERSKHKNLPKASGFVIWFKMFLLKCLSSGQLLKNIYRFVDFRVFKEKNSKIQNYFQDYKPDIVFSTSVISVLDIAFMKEAKRRRIPTVSMQKGWDNLLNLYYRFAPDYFFVSNEMSIDIAVKYQNLIRENIYVTGLPQFDWYSHQEIIKSREEHLKSKDLDPNRALIFFGSEGIWSTSDHEVAEKIHKWIINDEFVRPCSLIARPHYTNVVSDVFKNLRGKKHVFVDDYRITNFMIDSWDLSVDEIIDFTNSIYHCDVLINIASTLALDASALDRPVVSVMFGCSYEEGKDISVSALYGANHDKWVLDSNATARAYNYEDLKQKINEYLQNPKFQSNERGKLIESICYKIDGKSSMRLVDAINDIMQKRGEYV